MDTFIKRGLIEFFRSTSEKSSLPRSSFQDTSDRIAYSTGIDYAPCNGVIEKKEIGLQHHDVREMIDFFNAKKLPFVWWSHDPFLETQGFQFGGIMTGIVLDISQPVALSLNPPFDVKVKIVETAQELQAFCKVLAECFGLSPEVEKQYVLMSKMAMDRKEQVHFLAYVEGVPVSTATLTTLPQAAGIWNCGTLSDYRNKGLGTLLCSTASKVAQDMHHQQIMAILMPKGLAWGVFKKLGYKEVATLPLYVYGASAHDLEK